jgi:SAM-dependent methyltransferase
VTANDEAYGLRFHNLRQPGSARSARVVVPLVVDLLHPASVVDVGCGVGSWLAEFKRLGVPDVLGIDGPAAAHLTQLEHDEFLTHDLSTPILLDRRFDLAVCLEVAEHLPGAAAPAFVAQLVALAPVILFSAAVPHQGGTGHLNEQWPEYWAEHFAGHERVPVDWLRPQLWANPDVDFWYAQNLLLFADPAVIGSDARLSGAASVTRADALARVHPALYLAKVRQPELTVRSVVSALPHLVGRAVTSGARRSYDHLRHTSAGGRKA